MFLDMLSDLPQELVDVVIDYLHRYRSTLRACSLTCSSWVSPSRYHLFYRLLLKDESTLVRWSESFPDHTNSPSSYVKELIFRKQPNPATLDNVLEHFRSFTQVQNLVVVDLVVHLFRDPPIHHYFGHFSSSLRRLNLVAPAATSELLDFLCLFPHLETLIMFNPVSQVSPVPLVTTVSPPFSGTLMLLGFESLIQTSFIKNLCSLPNGINFRKIRLSCEPTSQRRIQDIVTILHACGRSCEDLFLSTDFKGELAVFVHRAKLTCHVRARQ